MKFVQVAMIQEKGRRYLGYWQQNHGADRPFSLNLIRSKVKKKKKYRGMIYWNNEESIHWSPQRD